MFYICCYKIVKNMRLNQDTKIEQMYQKIKNEMSEATKNAGLFSPLHIKYAEHDFLINEIAKLRLEIEYLKEHKSF